MFYVFLMPGHISGTPDYVYCLVYMLWALHRPDSTTSWVVESGEGRGGGLPCFVFMTYRIVLACLGYRFHNVSVLLKSSVVHGGGGGGG